MAKSLMGWRLKVKLKGEVVAYVARHWEAECAVEGCPYHGGVMAHGWTKGEVTRMARAHYLEEHSDA